MAREAIEGREEAIAAIREHLAAKGKDGVMEMREVRFPHVKLKTWYAWIEQAKKKPFTPQMFADARAALAASIDDPSILDAAVSRVLPPAPATIADIGPAEARRSLNLINRHEQLWQDCLMVRAHSVKSDEGKETIKLLKAFMQSISMRSGILKNVMDALEKLWNMKRMQDFHDSVVEEIAKESPECAARILARLSALSESCGMTMDVRV